MSNLRKLMAICIASAICWSPAMGHANESRAQLDQLKAAYLFNLIRFVQWESTEPADPESTEPEIDSINVCVNPASSLATVAQNLDNKRLDELRTISVKLSPPKNGCHVYFGARTINRQINQAAAANNVLAAPTSEAEYGQGAMLTVDDSLDALESGSLVQLFVHQGKLRFKTHPDLNAPSQHGLRFRISSKLLRLARNE